MSTSHLHLAEVSLEKAFEVLGEISNIEANIDLGCAQVVQGQHPLLGRVLVVTTVNGTAAMQGGPITA